VRSTNFAAKWSAQAWLLPALLAALIYILSTGNRAIIDYDEGHYVQAAQQMVLRGDWVTPYVNGVRFLEKPPLMYWMAAISFVVFGISEFALRLPTALGVAALTFIVSLMGKRIAGNRGALIAGTCTAFCVGTILFTRETIPDIWLVLFITLAMYAFQHWYLDPKKSWHWGLLFYAASAGAVMTKSLVGLAFPVGIPAVFFLLMREWPPWRRLHLISGTLLFLLLVVPWHWLAAHRNEGFLYFFFVNEQFLRFLGRHDPPVVWSLGIIPFWGLILVWFLPWTAFLPAAFGAARKAGDPAQRVTVKLVLAWSAVILGFFTVSGRSRESPLTRPTPA
jgi:4-amino-4-deoxy-L-arabinose transferase-like glycosyltransferase